MEKSTVFCLAFIIVFCCLSTFTALQCRHHWVLSIKLLVCDLQALFTIVMILYYSLTNNEYSQYIGQTFLISLVNFAFFLPAQLYLSLHFYDQNQRQLNCMNTGLGLMISFYYWLNMFNGLLFVLFSFYFCALKAHQFNNKQIHLKLQQTIRQASGTEQPCSICFSQFKEKEQICQLRCAHVFHSECIESWLRHKQSCPLCRTTRIFA